MKSSITSRRNFLASSGLSVWLLSKFAQSAQGVTAPFSQTEFSAFSRYKPSYGGPPGSPHYLGKLVSGLRKSGLPPVPVECPDVDRLPWKMVDGAKEFHLHCMAVKRELLPGYPMTVWGYNGAMPGPTIEVFQGDRVRIVLHNDLPEPTTIHCHGVELQNAMDGVDNITQDPIPPGGKFVYEFTAHQVGTYFYHSHFPMQEALGTVGFLIMHPRIAYEPTVDRDLGLIFQQFFIRPNTSNVDTMMMDANWHTINGRSGPYTTPLVVKHGERVRVRLLNFSPIMHHPIHFHGHTFWLTGSEGGRIPESAWIPRNVVLTGVAMVQEFEFIANNLGDWLLHCHMTHHMMNHMTWQVGPRIRPGSNMATYWESLPDRPEPENVLVDPKFAVPNYPQNMQGMTMSWEMGPEAMNMIHARRETHGMHPNWPMTVMGMMTVLRVLPEDLYNRLMHSDEKFSPGQIFHEIANRQKQR